MDKANGGNSEPGNPLTQGQDDDLVQFNLSVTAPETYYSDKVELAHFRDLTRLRVWGQRNRTNLILTDAPGYYSKKWTPGYQTTPIYVEGRAASSGYQSTDPFLRWQYWGDNSYALGGWNSDFWVTVVHVDMDMDGVKDEAPGDPLGVTEETIPGGFIPLGGMKALTIKKVAGTTTQPDVTLSWTGSKIEVWDGGTKLTSGKVYHDSELPKTVSVKGIAPGSSVRDTEITLQCTLGGQTFHDTIKLTVVKVSLDVEGVPENQEENPGLYINVNWDDDDGDGWEPNDTPPNGTYTGDKGDPYVYDPVKAPLGDDDLRFVGINIEPSGLTGSVQLTYSGGIAVWETMTKKLLSGESSYVASGAQFAAASLPTVVYVEGVSGSLVFRNGELKATYSLCPATDLAKVTVFEVNLAGFFAYGDQHEDDSVKQSQSPRYGSSDKNGMISWDDANADGQKGDNDVNCIFFHNCMECQGTVEPTRVTDQVQFDIKRDKWLRTWYITGDGWQLLTEHVPWASDDANSVTDEDLSPSATDHIYSVDGPGAYSRDGTVLNYYARIDDFREYVLVQIGGTWYQCSDFYKWHDKMSLKPKQGGLRYSRSSRPDS